MNFKNFFVKYKQILICLIVSLGVGIAGGKNGIPEEDFNNLVAKNNKLNDEIVLLDKQLEERTNDVNKLQQRKVEADKIVKAEADRKAKEEAEAKREAEVKAEAEAKAEAERNAKVEQGTNYVASGGNNDNGSNTKMETPIGNMVWLSETGSKYHSRNNCGRMNPAKARQVTVDNAVSQGYAPCSKCF